MADQDGAERSKHTPQAELARRLRLLIKAAVAEGGGPVLFPDVRAAMTVRGVKLSRARWLYMKDGNGALIRDRPLLTALADYFNADPEYLLSVEGTALTGEQLEVVKSLRVARVKSFAVNTLGDVSPEVLDALIEYLDRDIARPPGGEAVDDSGDSPDAHPEVP